MKQGEQIAGLLRRHRLDDWAAALPALIDQALDEKRHGDLGRWLRILQAMPPVTTHDLDLDADRVRIGRPEELDEEQRQGLSSALRALQPWRKGPFEVFGIQIDAEWRSDWKWRRLAPHIQPLSGRRVLDVGCGNGYYALRMAGAGAALVVGVDPGLLYWSQFQALHRLMAEPPPVAFLPLGFQDLPESDGRFDTVFSMGLLYHRRDPLGHLAALRRRLRPGGELVLETLVVEGDARTVLVPPGRYARMRNVWFIPSPDALCLWLERCGFQEPRVVAVTPTTTEEQRTTDWMGFESLAQALDPEDATRTLEGHPAPVRALVLARR